MIKSPETAMMGHGYKPELSEGAVKPPVFLTSTFVFHTAEEGKDFFTMAHGHTPAQEREMGLIYSRINNPNIEILEERIRLWDGGADAAAFSSGMSAISTTMMAFLKPGDFILFSNPLYGGSHKFIQHFLKELGIGTIGFSAGDSFESIVGQVAAAGAAGKLKMIFVETPANPTGEVIDVRMCSELAKYFSTEDKPVLLAVDNTYMGPLWSRPLQFGADIVLYSATKYIGGHSDVIAGAAVGSKSIIQSIKAARTFFGTIIDPHPAWMLLRSLETLKLRMDAAAQNAAHIAAFLQNYPGVEKVYYPGLRTGMSERQQQIYAEQYTSFGAMVSFDVAGGEPAAFRFLNALRHIKLAVSLGGTESLAQHPWSMTHSGVPESEKLQYGITEGMVRLSVGIEHHEDLIRDMEQALLAARL
ncbi:cystathionine gamma-synthase family protein [Chitinophaga caseinilytica]|uniref:cystathionine gamma-synthase family protein n=1 Tax=Chitinophaga caseinilytica TaxID=2267521 RepID=UPI003C2DF124